MSEGSTASGGEISSQDKILFWGCFIALITTAFGFIARMFLINTWALQFGLDGPEAGRLAGIGIWPFAASIIGFSLVIDRIGYKAAAIFAFVGHAVWAVMGVSAFFVAETDRETAYALLYWGSLILALGNGAVEAFINPVVATMFSREKTKWLNILHAGWPGGLVIAGVLTILLGDVDWWVRVGVIAIPAVVYLVMLLPCKFPENERVESGVTYKDMLSEFGVLGAAIVGVLVALQLMDFFKPPGDNAVLDPGLKYMFIGIGVAIVAAFGVYTRALGRPLMFILVLIMMPLATTEIGTDGWITGIMEGVFQMTPEEVAAAGGEENVLMIGGNAFKMHPGWVLVQTSLIMMVLRFFAGPIIHRLSPLGLLTLSAVLAIVGLYTLSFTSGMMIFVAATIYALGKTFFWPTMLGVVSEQTPKGGALTLNAISGIGMLAVGTLGFPYIGALQADKEIQAVAASQVASEVPGLVKDDKVVTLTDKSIYEVIKYQAIDNAALDKLVSELPEAKQAAVSDELSSIRKNSSQGALANMVIFPTVMLIGYILIILYFKSKGGYKAVELDGGDG